MTSTTGPCVADRGNVANGCWWLYAEEQLPCEEGAVGCSLDLMVFRTLTTYCLGFCFLLFFETGFHYVALAGLELMM